MPTWLLRFRVYGLRHRRLEHDPEKLALDPIGGVKRFSEKIMLNQVQHCGCDWRAAQKLCGASGERLSCLTGRVEQQGRGDMRRVFLAALSVCLWAPVAWAQGAPAASPVCVYESRSYSDGALICMNRALMLSCSLDGSKASWKPVDDPKLASVCEASRARPRVVEAPPRPRHRHGLRHSVRVNADRSAKCFVFNGKQYCE
jgi:hypothetical protein